MTPSSRTAATGGVRRSTAQPARQPHVLPVMDAGLFGQLFGEAAVARLGTIATLEPECTASEIMKASRASTLARADVLLTCWGAPTLDATVLDAAPHLRAVVHAAGTVKEMVTEQSWARGIAVSSAAWANARPVAEYTLAAILASNKRILELRDRYAVKRSAWDPRQLPREIGNQGRTIGIVGASHVGRRVIELLAPFGFEILLSDPYVTTADASQLGARLRRSRRTLRELRRGQPSCTSPARDALDARRATPPPAR